MSPPPPPPRPEDKVQDCRADPSLAASPAREEEDGLNGGGCGEGVVVVKPPLPAAPAACGGGVREKCRCWFFEEGRGREKKCRS